MCKGGQVKVKIRTMNSRKRALQIHKDLVKTVAICQLARIRPLTQTYCASHAKPIWLRLRQLRARTRSPLFVDLLKALCDTRQEDQAHEAWAKDRNPGCPSWPQSRNRKSQRGEYGDLQEPPREGVGTVCYEDSREKKYPDDLSPSCKRSSFFFFLPRLFDRK